MRERLDECLVSLAPRIHTQCQVEMRTCQKEEGIVTSLQCEDLGVGGSGGQQGKEVLNEGGSEEKLYTFFRLTLENWSCWEV